MFNRVYNSFSMLLVAGSRINLHSTILMETPRNFSVFTQLIAGHNFHSAL